MAPATREGPRVVDTNMLILLPLSGHRGPGWTCRWLDAVAN